MLKRIAKWLGKQSTIPWIGEFKETLSQALFWGSVLNITMVGGTFYYTTLRHVFPWFDLPKFMMAVIGVLVCVYIIEFKFIIPSIWAFRARQMGVGGNLKGDKQLVVAVSGGFDPIHKGHVRHIKKAMELGRVIVILTRDDQLVAKKGKVFMEYDERKEIIEAIIVDRGGVVVNIDNTVASVDSIKKYHPDIFAKGGDTWDIDNLPEADVCKELGIKVVFGIGGVEKVQSSSQLIKEGKVGR